jgi:EmrB/QacA subfamily drug resistance transporter
MNPLLRLLDPLASARVRSGRVLLVTFLAAWMAAFMTTAINIALPSIQTEFHLDAVAVGWLPLAYIVASAVFLLPFAKLGDRYGRRLIFLSGVALFFLSSVALGLSHSYPPLVVFRALQGIGGSMMFSTAMALVTTVYPPARRGWAMGVSVAAAYLGQTMGPIIGGVIVYNIGWRSLFLVTGCFALFNITLDLWLLRRAEWREDAGTGFDWAGSATYAVGLCAFLLGLSWVELPRGVALLLIGLIGIAFFLWWETRSKNPVIEVSLFRRNRVFALSNLTALISYSSVWAVTFLMSFYLQDIKGLNPERAGEVLIAGVALQAAISPFGGRLSDRIEPRWLASAGMLFCVAGLSLLSLLDTATPYWYVILALCLLGLGYAFFSGPNQSSIMGSVERRHLGFASASISTVRTVGMAISVAAATLIMALIVGRHDFQPADYPNLLRAIRLNFAIFTGVCAFSVVASLVRGKMPRPESESDPSGAGEKLPDSHRVEE